MFVKVEKTRVDGFVRASAQMHGNLPGPPLELPIMEKAEAGTQERQDSCGAVLLGGKHSGRTGLIMILEETRRFHLEVRIGTEVIAYGPGMPFAESIVEPLVVGVIEPLLLQCPFEVPIDLRHEQEIGIVFANRMDCVWPEGFWSLTPGALKHFGEDQHCHVTANAVAVSCNSFEFTNHSLL